MRCFIAIEISDEIRKALGELIQRLSGMGRGIRWVPPENIHLTLKFLGEVEDDRVPEIGRRLSEISSGHSPISLRVRGAGAFPSLRSPQVIWVGSEVSPGLESLYREIEEAMAALGFERERRDFNPHLTLGRVKDRRALDPVMKELQLMKDQDWGAVEVTEVVLMKSVLTPKGAEYSRVSVFPLSGS